MANRGTMIGLIVLVIGILLFAVAVALPQTASANVPAGDGWEITTSAIGGASVSMTWSGGSASTAVTLFDCGSACPSDGSTSGLAKTATGSGGSGSFSATLSSGHTYLFLETNGTATLSVSYSALGLSILGVIGIVVAAIGLVLLIVLRPKAPPAEPMYDPAPAEGDAEAAPAESS